MIKISRDYRQASENAYIIQVEYLTPMNTALPLVNSKPAVKIALAPIDIRLPLTNMLNRVMLPVNNMPNRIVVWCRSAEC